eukprot:TRINITY_DN29877_c0_g1_i1.p2 TRINITY_DN29877_c0_g1~~TRINITY_DN29877_c0_g1_i1.p2  ORF type:complete len:457 (+),score=123.36 TRINITY_DN29877_c0_g1_i1:66-1436(+)
MTDEAAEAAAAAEAAQTKRVSALLASLIGPARAAAADAVEQAGRRAATDAAVDHAAAVQHNLFRHVGGERAVLPPGHAPPGVDRARECSPRRRNPPLFLNAYSATQGGARGREGLPGGYRESRAMSPPQPLDLAARTHSRQSSRHSARCVSTEGSLSGAGGDGGDMEVGTTDAAVSPVRGLGVDTGDAEVQWSVDDLLEEDRKALQQAERRARKRAAREAERKAAEDMDAAVQGLLRCEHIAVPHTIIGPYKEEWDALPDSAVLDTCDRKVKAIAADAQEAVRAACRRLERRMDGLLDEHTEDRKGMQLLQYQLEEQQEAINAAQAVERELRAKIITLTNDAVIFRERETRHAARIKSLDEENRAMRETCGKYERLVKEHRALRSEHNMIARRVRAAFLSESDNMLPTYAADGTPTKPEKKAWIPPGGTFAEPAVDEDAAYRPWTYSSPLHSPRGD